LFQGEILKILAFDTSLTLCSVALSTGTEVITRQKNAPQQHNELILPMIDEVLKRADLKLTQLDAISFGCGPGSFTGVRLAASIAQGLAYGANLPVIPVSTLRILAQTAYANFGNPRVLVIQDARMEQVYWGAYQMEDDLMTAVTSDAIAYPKQIKFSLVGDWTGIGNGWRIYQDQLQGFTLSIIQDEILPEAESLIKLAISDFKKQKTVAPHLALPVYLGGGKTWKESN